MNDLDTEQLIESSYSTINDDNVKKLREAFAVLTQGVEMNHYDAEAIIVDKKKQKKIVWVDPDILRICCDYVRPSMVERALGKVPPGIYIRDIAEVRAGAQAYDFIKNPDPDREDAKCLTLIGTERAISLEFPSQFTRDWFLERFRILVDDILLDEEKSVRNFQKFCVHDTELLTNQQIEAATNLVSVLQRGVQILHHRTTGKIVKSKLVFDESKLLLSIQSLERGYFNLWSDPEYTLSVLDISEIRPGGHSFNFVKTSSLDKGSQLLSIIGSEDVFDIQFTSEYTRDAFDSKFRLFVKHFQAKSRSEARQGEDL